MTTKQDFENIQNAERIGFKINRLIIVEWVSILAVFITCFAYLAHKIDRQSERTDRLYEMFIDLLKEKK
jgi:hypothetical protein